jgi:uncharacterized protein YegL
MKDNLAEIVVILDRSGSMQPLTDDTIGGFNSFIEKQKEIPGEAHVTTVLFNTVYTVLHNRAPLHVVKPITRKEYTADGGTALLDAVGKAINTVGTQLWKMDEADRPSKVIVLIITDGEENSSKEYTNQQIKDMVKHQQEVYNWQFLFFGANIDSFSTADALGISIDMAANYSPTEEGTQSIYAVMSSTTANYRQTGQIDKDYKQGII